MAYGRISKKQQEILDYIKKSRFLTEVFPQQSGRFVRQLI